MKQIENYRPTIAKINLKAIQHNVQQLKKFIQPHVQIIAVVKANAYGHGMIAVSEAALQAGATILAVATADEAVQLRQHFQNVDILVLGATPPKFATFASDNNIMLTVFSTEWVQQAQQYGPFSKQLKLHIKIDSGMGRIGVTTHDELMQLFDAIIETKHFIVDGIFTHFATADEEQTAYFDNQAAIFKQLVNALPVKPRLVHAANTATILVKGDDFQFDAVRFGISMYGLKPSSYVGEHLPFPIEEAFTLETEIVHVKKMLPGQGVGYGSTFVTQEECYVGTLPIGYADGMIRKLSGQTVLVNGQRCPIIGRICMDQCMILLPRAYNIGERVVLLGSQNGDFISIDEWAQTCETINYEVPCIITSRVPRIYR
jgi:alanine racemase